MSSSAWRVTVSAAAALLLLGALLLPTTTKPEFHEAPVAGEPPDANPTLLGVEPGRNEHGTAPPSRAGSALVVYVRALSGDKPVAGARVEVRAARTVVTEHTTDAEGSVSIAGLTSGSLKVHARASGLVPSEVTVRHASDNGPTIVTLYLAGGHLVQGRVVDDRGHPVPNAIVVAAAATKVGSARVQAQRATSNADGEFEFTALPTGEQVLTAQWPDGWGGPGQRVRVPLSGTIDLLLARGAVIEGTVKRASTGTGLAGVTVRVSDIGYSASATARTDKQGEYQIGPFDPRRPPVYIRVTRPGYRPATQDAIADRGLAAPHPYIEGRTILDLGLGSGDRVRLDFVLGLGAVVVGTVRGPDGPVAEALVRAVPASGAAWTRTNAQGQYRLVGLAVRPVMIAVRAPGYLQAGAVHPVPTEDVESSAYFRAMGARPSLEKETVRDLRLERGRVWRIRVLNMSDAPLRSARPWARSTDGRSQPSITPGADGEFSLSGVAANGQLVVGARLDGYEGIEAAGIRVTEGTTASPIVVRMRRRKVLTVSGTISSRQEAELRGAYVQVAWVDRSGFALDPVGRWKLWASAKRHPVRADGSFSVHLSGSPGRFAVRAFALGHMAAYSADETAPSDLTEAEVELLLMPGNHLSGVILDAINGRPIEGARIGVTASDEESRTMTMWHAMPATSDSAGAFAVTGIPGGRHVLDVTAHGYLPAKNVAKVSGTSEEVVVRLSPADGRIEGVIEHDTGLPFEGARVHAKQGKRPSRRARSRRDGSFTLEGLPRSPTSVAARADGHAEALVADVPVGTLDLRLVLEPGVVAAGVVLDKKGRPLPNTWIRFVPSRANRVGMWVRTDSVGRFRRTDLAAGEHEIQVRLGRKHVSVGNAVLPDEDLVVRR